MTRRHEVLLALGSNVEPRRWLPIGLGLLMARFEVVAASSAHAGEAVGGPPGQPPFVNAAARIRTDCPPAALREVCRHLEARCGRQRTGDVYAPRTLDIDVVAGDPAFEALADGALPDPALVTAWHVLRPAAEAWPGFRPRGRAGTLEALASAGIPGAPPLARIALVADPEPPA